MGELVAHNYRVIRKVLSWQGQMCPDAFQDMESARLKWFNRLEENVRASETSRSSCRTISSTTSSRGRPYSRRRRRTESRRTSRTSGASPQSSNNKRTAAVSFNSTIPPLTSPPRYLHSPLALACHSRVEVLQVERGE
mmetsp:Transcript_5285/g.9619  ORF Transcript_5285/g.9619 Transcript_5285/m.9619 type:complete len:138 (-) Transcript_5285:97-510(-)